MEKRVFYMIRRFPEKGKCVDIGLPTDSLEWAKKKLKHEKSTPFGVNSVIVKKTHTVEILDENAIEVLDENAVLKAKIENAINCLVCAPIADRDEIIESAYKILTA